MSHISQLLVKAQEDLADTILKINQAMAGYENYKKVPCGLVHRAAGILLFRDCVDENKDTKSDKNTETASHHVSMLDIDPPHKAEAKARSEPMEKPEKTVAKSSKKEILLAFDQSKWVIPGGKGEGRESPFETASREFHEETGIKLPSSLRNVFLENIYYHPGKYTLFKVPQSFVEEHNSLSDKNAKNLTNKEEKTTTKDTESVKPQIIWADWQHANELLDSFGKILLNLPAVVDFMHK